MFSRILRFGAGLTPRSVKDFLKIVGQTRQVCRGYAHCQGSNSNGVATATAPADPSPLRAYFDAYRQGPGIYKWTHYFEVYERHFQKFRGREIHLLEIGIYSGGSLRMWRDYFGPKCHIYGVDVQPACKCYEEETVKVFLGDQSDRSFWKRFKEQVPALDIVIDDGGHEPGQQIVTFEELLPHLRPGGVFLCEDVHGYRDLNGFASYVNGFTHHLHAGSHTLNPDTADRHLVCPANAFQADVHSVHQYPFVIVVEKRDAPVSELVAQKHGTEWQPFLK
jgi:hypothetical protein